MSPPAAICASSLVEPDHFPIREDRPPTAVASYTASLIRMERRPRATQNRQVGDSTRDCRVDRLESFEGEGRGAGTGP